IKNENTTIINSSNNLEENLNENFEKIATNIFLENTSGRYIKMKLENSLGNGIYHENIELTVNDEKYELMTDNNGIVNLKINLDVGNYTFHYLFQGNENYLPFSGVSNLLIEKENIEIISENMTLNKKGDYLKVQISDKENNPVKNEEIFITINGIQYSRITDNEGMAKIKINLNPGTYFINIQIRNSKNYYDSSKGIKLIMLSSDTKLNANLKGYDLEQNYGDGNYYTIYLKDNNGEKLKNQTVTININGINYLRITNEEGLAKIKINLYPGTYEVKTSFENEYYNYISINNNIKVNVLKTNIITENITLYYGDGDYFKVKLIDINENPLSNKIVGISINGVTYNKETYLDGNAFIKINLHPGTYIIETFYSGDRTSSNSKIISKLNVLKHNTSLNSEKLTLNRKGESIEISLKDSYNKKLINQQVEITVNNITYFKITDDEGIARLKINLNPGIYNIFYNYPESFSYKSSKGSVNLTMLNEDVKLDTIISGENFNISQRGNQIKINLKDQNHINLFNEDIEITINGKTYYKTTDYEGNAYLTINLMDNSYDIFYTFKGSNYFYKSENKEKLIVNTIPNFNYKFNFTTKLDLYSPILNRDVKIPIARMMNITTLDGDYNLWYKINEAKNYIDVLDIQENMIYFIPLNNPSKDILIYNSLNDIKTQGIALIIHADDIEINFYGNLNNRINEFDVVFRCYNYSRAGYECVDLYLNGVKQASIEFTIYLSAPETFSELISTGTTITYSPEIIKSEFKFNNLNITRYNTISYNTINMHLNIPLNYWNSQLGYDAIQSYIISSSKITDKDVENYLANLNEYENIDKIRYECFLSALANLWLVDKMSDELAENYNVTINKLDYRIICSGINYNGRYIDSRAYFSDTDILGSEENIKSFKFIHSILFSEIEKLSLELTGQEVRCGYSDIIIAILNGEPISIIEYDDFIVVSIFNSSSEIIYYKDSGFVATKVSQIDSQTSKGAVANILGYSYPNTIFSNFKKLSSSFSKFGSSIIDLFNYRKKIDYNLILKGSAVITAGRNLFSSTPSLIGFMVTTTEFMCAFRDTLDYGNWKYFGVYPIWKGKTFQFVSDEKVIYTDYLGNTHEVNDQVHVIIPYKNKWSPIGENELDRNKAYLISDYYGRVNISAEDTYRLEEESNKYYIERGHGWITEIEQ
ncbi:hypothetical protein LJB96_04685, partial [Methanobrevibacter sp. OttesenSCG-928-K11]|nr:hypothetical protein [Methanobrevibacter sp. OttesenSCG-928-K11]